MKNKNICTKNMVCFLTIKPTESFCAIYNKVAQRIFEGDNFINIAVEECKRLLSYPEFLGFTKNSKVKLCNISWAWFNKSIELTNNGFKIEEIPFLTSENWR